MKYIIFSYESEIALPHKARVYNMCKINKKN